jgi:two-component system, NtrC family, sensor kinase
MSWKFPFYLNIRKKIIVGLTIMMVVMGSIGAFSFRYLLEIERKQRFGEIADDLREIILEVRRYEKNYLLYASAEDLEENRRYTQQATDMVGQVIPEVADFQGAPMLNRLHQEILKYRDLMADIASRERKDGQITRQASEEKLRENGKALVEISQQLVVFERDRILKIVKTLKAQLLSTLLIFLSLGALFIPFVARRILRPLRVIEKTTLRIAQGDFRPVPVLDTRDETERVVQAFNRMVSELEKRQDQLVQAKKLASLGTLTSGIAHQLNNPLNNISTSCQILLEELIQADPELQRKMLTNIEQEVHRARDIVRGLLEFSRVKEFCMVPTPLAQVVNRSVTLMSSQIPPGIQIVKDIPEDLSLNLDAQRMQQVILNLIENAVHAIKNPPGEIRIGARVAPTQDMVLVTVEDTGRGIPEKVMGRVFDPFFTTKEVGMGTGLGLSIVYGIIQKHEGSITVESKEGEGTRFIIRLPLHAVC